MTRLRWVTITGFDASALNARPRPVSRASRNWGGATGGSLGWRRSRAL